MLESIAKPSSSASPPVALSALSRVRQALLILPLIFTALLGSVFYQQATRDENFRYYPFVWRAQWIMPPFSDTQTACFRKHIWVSGSIKTAYVAVTSENFYEMMVNGRAVNGFFRPGVSRLLPKDSTTYNALGYPRRGQLARVFNIAPLLRSGHNVITVFVQSDEGPPRLIAQGAVYSNERLEIRSDASWRCAPSQEWQGVISWNSPHFMDGDWSHALATNERPSIPVDGETEVFEAPLRGYFLNAGTVRPSSMARFKRILTCPDTNVRGWLRVGTVLPYDLAINGKIVGSTSMVDRYSRSLLSRRGSVDALGRTQTGGTEYQYPTILGSSSIDVFMLKNLLRPGINEIEVTVHNKEATRVSHIPGIYLDGRFFFKDGSTQEIMTDGSWQAQSEGSALWQSAQIAATASDRFVVTAKMRIRGAVDAGGATYLRIIRNGATLLAAILILTWLTSVVLGRLGKRGDTSLFLYFCLTYLAPVSVLTLAFVTQAIFHGSPQDTFFSSSQFAFFALIGALIAWSIALALMIWQACRMDSFRSANAAQGAENRVPAYRVAVARYGCAGLLAAIMLTALAFYTRSIGRADYLPDEYVSLLAAKGILRTGIPYFEETGVVYTRSALFHYLLAFWMMVTGSVTSPYSTRLVACFWQMLTIPLIYLFGREARGRAAGLLAAALIAFSPYVIYYAREARFYTQLTFFCTLTFYLLLRSVRAPEREGYRLGVMLAYCGAYLSQQFAVAMAPAIGLVVILSGQARLWLRGRSLLGIGFILFVMAADFIAYSKWCQTPLPFVDTEAVLPLAFHTDILEVLPSMLLTNNERAQLILGIIYILGFVVVLAHSLLAHRRSETSASGWAWWSYLYLTSLVTILFTTLISSRPANRYIVHLVPLFSLTAACGIVQCSQFLGDTLARFSGRTSQARLVQWTCIVGVLLICLSAYRPARTWNALDRDNNRGVTVAARFIARNRLPSDKVMFFSPEVAQVELGKCDYMWRPRRGSIFKYVSKDGRIRERNSGAVVVDNVDKLRQVIARHPRVWLVVHGSTIGASGYNLDGQMNRLALDNFKVVAEPFGMRVMLWDQARNHYSNSARSYGFEQLNF